MGKAVALQQDALLCLSRSTNSDAKHSSASNLSSLRNKAAVQGFIFRLSGATSVSFNTMIESVGVVI